MELKQRRKSYTKEFKLEAIKLTEDSGRTAAQIAHELGISVNLLYNWRNQFKYKKEAAFAKASRLTSEQQEIIHLRLEVARLREERDIFKKAVACFAKETE